MNRAARGAATIASACALAATFASEARADDAVAPFGGTPLGQLPGAIQAGGFVFRPLVDFRARAEVWSEVPLESEGSVLAPERKTTLSSSPDAFISERSRLGIAAERGPVSAVITLQDAREFGSTGGALSTIHDLPRFEPHEAYLDLHTDSRQVFFRAGRQEVELGDGRLVGTSDGSATGRSLDAVRLGGRIKRWDLQVLAAMLEPPSLGGKDDNPGAQLYAADATWRIAPLFGLEFSALARITRGTSDATLSPSNTFVPWVRVFGDSRNIHYSLTGAFEAGNDAYVGGVRTQIAGAVAGRLDWLTSLPGRLALGVEGAFATGRDPSKGASATDGAFDPILPDSTAAFGQAGFIGWSNLIEAGLDIGFAIGDPVHFQLGYKFAGMPESKGTWFSSSLTPIGSDPNNTSNVLGHILFAGARVTPLREIDFKAEYSAMILDGAGSAIFKAAGSDAGLIHYGMIQAAAHIP